MRSYERTDPRSDALVFFGATGDLAYKQIFPALAALVARGRLRVPVIGVAKAGWGRDQLVKRARESLAEHGWTDNAAADRLCGLLRYVDGDYQDPVTFKNLRAELGQARAPLHYLAIPPDLFGTVVRALDDSGCADGGRVVVVQNHMLQVLSLLAMEPPPGYGHEDIRDETAKALRAIPPLRRDAVVRGQFTGYTTEDGVASDSTVETFAALRAHVESGLQPGRLPYPDAGLG